MLPFNVANICSSPLILPKIQDISNQVESIFSLTILTRYCMIFLTQQVAKYQLFLTLLAYVLFHLFCQNTRYFLLSRTQIFVKVLTRYCNDTLHIINSNNSAFLCCKHMFEYSYFVKNPRTLTPS